MTGDTFVLAGRAATCWLRPRFVDPTEPTIARPWPADAHGNLRRPSP